VSTAIDVTRVELQKMSWIFGGAIFQNSQQLVALPR
jgi:hypothetical protein